MKIVPLLFGAAIGIVAMLMVNRASEPPTLDTSVPTVNFETKEKDRQLVLDHTGQFISVPAMSERKALATIYQVLMEVQESKEAMASKAKVLELDEVKKGVSGLVPVE